MANVITYGTFDLFHIGHLRMLERAKELAGGGGYLIVAVSTDEFNWNEKRKKCVVPYEQRAAIVGALKCVDQVIPETSWEQKKLDVVNRKIDIFVIGEDWKGKFDFLSDVCKVEYLPRTGGISSTDIKAIMERKDVAYENYREPFVLKCKKILQKILKSSSLGNVVYPFFQRRWRSYIIPKRRKRLQRFGFDTIERVHQLMQKNGIEYYCDYGTLIGLVRENGFLKNDDDIDISIPPGAAIARDVLKVFLDAGYGYVHGFEYQGKMIEFTVADATGITIDVFFPESMAEEGKIHGYQPIWEHQRSYPNEKANTLIQYVFTAATGIKTAKFGDVAVSIPSNYDEVLTSEYGPWKIPDSKFNTVYDRVHSEMPGFAYRLTKEEAVAH